MGTEFATGVGEGDDGDVAGRAAAEDARSGMDATSTDFAVVFCSPTYDCQAVIAGVKSVIGDTTLVGATAHGKFTERGVHTSAYSDAGGVTIALIASDEMRFFTGLGRNVSEDPEASVAEATAQLPDTVEGYPHRSGLFLASTLLGREEVAQLTYQAMPIQWGGGGAADYSLENVTVFVGEETAHDAILLTMIASKRPVAIGVGNRHEPIGGSVRVTKSEGNVVHELDGKPAYEVWKDLFDDVARERYGYGIEEIEQSRERVMQAFTEFVFGLRTGEDMYKVRSAFATAYCEPYSEFGVDAEVTTDDGHPVHEFPTFRTLPDGALQFSEPIPEGVVLHPMTSGKEGTIERGTRSVRDALGSMQGERVAGGLVFECPCGEATLQEDYHKLVEAVAEPLHAPIAGIQSGGGEVCFRHGDMRGVNHTSTTLLLFPGGEEA